MFKTNQKKLFLSNAKYYRVIITFLFLSAVRELYQLQLFFAVYRNQSVLPFAESAAVICQFYLADASETIRPEGMFPGNDTNRPVFHCLCDPGCDPEKLAGYLLLYIRRT